MTEQNSQQATSTENNQKIVIDGKEYTSDEIKAGMLMQSDYTKKMQELAEERKKLANNPAEDPDEAVVKALKEKGFVSHEEIEKMLETRLSSMKSERQLEELVSYNPELSKFEGAIKELHKSTGKSYDTIIEEYGFGKKDKLRSARLSRDIPGGNAAEGLNTQSKDVKDMTDEEFIKAIEDAKK